MNISNNPVAILIVVLLIVFFIALCLLAYRNIKRVGTPKPPTKPNRYPVDEYADNPGRPYTGVEIERGWTEPLFRDRFEDQL